MIYVVSYGEFNSEEECPNWREACALMRHLILQGTQNIRVRAL